MAALTSDVRVDYDANKLPSFVQIPSGITGTFYRGAIVSSHLGKATTTPLENEFFVGVCHARIVAEVDTLITCAVTGRYHFFSAGIITTDYGELFAINTALSDNPADIAIIDAGSAGPMGSLDQVTSTGISGWINIDRRA